MTVSVNYLKKDMRNPYPHNVTFVVGSWMCCSGFDSALVHRWRMLGLRTRKCVCLQLTVIACCFCGGEVVECRVASYLFGGVWCAGGGTCALRRALVEFGASAVVGEAVSRPICVDESLGNCPVGSGAVRFVWDVRGCCAWDRWISSL